MAFAVCGLTLVASKRVVDSFADAGRVLEGPMRIQDGISTSCLAGMLTRPGVERVRRGLTEALRALKGRRDSALMSGLKGLAMRLAR